MSSIWVNWVRRLQSIAQNGRNYCKNEFDLQRYQQVEDVAAEIAARYSDGELKTIKAIFKREAGPATPKIDVRAAVISEDKILLVKERGDGWTLPGGWVDPGESPSEAAVRETKEESGYDVNAVRLIAIYDRDRHGHPPCPFHVYKLIFLCKLVGGSAKTSLETEAACFFREDELPTFSESRVLLPQVKRAFAFAGDPNLPADFD
ncbi:MAG TPA: NUDIX hydrolase [Candidatus Udaeobacter sp.]|jgi:ADP-ribose pyrophosphatase YjhB (NUDIX family)|nr:NUDIX hydrolase [Candidatus Udaeobacter sp.]